MEYKSPILTSVFNILGVLVLIAAALGVGLLIVVGVGSREPAALLPAIGTAIVAFLAAITYFGIAQVIDFLGRTAHSADSLHTAMQATVVPRLNSLEKRFNSDTPLLVRVAGIPDPPPQHQRIPGAVFHYAVGGKDEGPFTAKDMKDLREAGVISEETAVFRAGESEWRSYRDFPELNS